MSDEGVGVGVGVGVGLCAIAGVAAEIMTTNTKVMAIAVTIRRTRSSPIVCNVPEGRNGQLIMTNPEANDCAQKCNTNGTHLR